MPQPVQSAAQLLVTTTVFIKQPSPTGNTTEIFLELITTAVPSGKANPRRPTCDHVYQASRPQEEGVLGEEWLAVSDACVPREGEGERGQEPARERKQEVAEGS